MPLKIFTRFKLPNQEQIYGFVFFVLLIKVAIPWLPYNLPVKCYRTDFDIFINAADVLSHKGNIYGVFPMNFTFKYYYSVFFAMLLVPFVKYHALGKAVWLLFSFVFYCRSFVLIKRYLPNSTFSSTRYNIWLLLIFILTITMLTKNTITVQMTPFLLWGMLESLSLAHFKNKPLLAGVIMGLLINIKIMPIIFLGYLIYRGYYKTVAACLLTFIGLLFIPSLFIGHGYNMYLLGEWWAAISPFNTEHNVENINELRVNLGSLILAYLMDGPPMFDGIALKRNFVNLNPMLVRQITTLASLLLAGLSLAFLRSLPFRKENNLLKQYWEVAYFLLVIPLIMPHQQVYALLLALPLIAYLLYFFVYTFTKQQTKAYYFVLFVFVVSALFFSPVNAIDTPINGLRIISPKAVSIIGTLKLISFATLALIPVALYCTPDKLAKMLDVENYKNLN